MTIVVLCGTISANVSPTNFKSYKIAAKLIITGADYLTPTTELLSRLGWTNLKDRRNKQKDLMRSYLFNGMTSDYTF